MSVKGDAIFLLVCQCQKLLVLVRGRKRVIWISYEVVRSGKYHAELTKLECQQWAF